VLGHLDESFRTKGPKNQVTVIHMAQVYFND
jgi:hypothetical protein